MLFVGGLFLLFGAADFVVYFALVRVWTVLVLYRYVYGTIYLCFRR